MAAIVGTLLGPAATLADDPLACVDEDIVEALLRGPAAASPEITRNWSPKVPRISLPAEFSLIGSRTLPYTAVVALETALTSETAMSQLDRSMAGAGWSAFETDAPVQKGFQMPVRGQRAAPGIYCKEGEGIVTSAMRKSERGTTYVMLVTTRQSLLSACQSTHPSMPWHPSQSRLPTLRFPEGVRFTNGGGSGSDGEGGESTRIRIASAVTATVLLDYLDRQLTEQGWRRGAQWTATRLSGSTWESIDEPLVGLLTIATRRDGEYDLAFEAIPAE
jgi:hypothetical protein